MHQLQGLAQRRLRRAGHRRLARQRAERRLEGLLGQCLRGLVALQRAPRQVEELLHAAVEEVGPGRAGGRDLAHDGGVDLEAEAVLERLVARSDGTLGEQRPDREEVTGFVLEAAAAHLGHPLAADDRAAADEQQSPDRPRGRLQQALARGVVGLPCCAGEALDVGAAHLGERRVAPKLGDDVADQAG